jgi:hypothetical protein
MIKNASTSSNWTILDTKRGLDYNVNYDPFLRPNLNNAEAAAFDCANPLATGFQLKATSVMFNTNNDTFIYLAVRRGSLFPPEAGDASKVFAIDTAHSDNNNTVSGDMFTAGFPVDMGIYKTRSSSSSPHIISARLTQGASLYTNATDVENTSTDFSFDHQTGWSSGSTTITTDKISWMWKRAPSYFDVVAYTGTGSARTVSHNLSAVPEMLWVKGRSQTGSRWAVYHKDIGNTKYLFLNETDAASTFNAWQDTTPTSSVFSLSTWGDVNGSGETFIAYLFATVAGVSKVGSYTGNGSTQNIDCGFSSGARFVLIKKTNSSGGWIVFDSVRGIVSGNDPYLFLNNTNAEGSGYDLLDPYSAGFNIASGDATINASGDNYIFYAIA